MSEREVSAKGSREVYKGLGMGLHLGFWELGLGLGLGLGFGFGSGIGRQTQRQTLVLYLKFFKSLSSSSLVRLILCGSRQIWPNHIKLIMLSCSTSSFFFAKYVVLFFIFIQHYGFLFNKIIYVVGS